MPGLSISAGFDFGLALEAVSEHPTAEPRAALVPPNGEKRFTVIVDGAEDRSLKELINQALRRGLMDLSAPAKPREPFRTRPVSLGRCLICDIVSISEAIALAEGEDHK